MTWLVLKLPYKRLRLLIDTDITGGLGNLEIRALDNVTIDRVVFNDRDSEHGDMAMDNCDSSDYEHTSQETLKTGETMTVKWLMRQRHQGSPSGPNGIEHDVAFATRET